MKTRHYVPCSQVLLSFCSPNFFFFVNGTQYFSVDHSSIFTYLDGYLSGFIDGKRLGETTMVKSISN